MTRFIRLIALGAALSASPALADAGSTARPDRTASAEHGTKHTHDCAKSDCCARHVIGRPGDVSPEQRDREGWGAAG